MNSLYPRTGCSLLRSTLAKFARSSCRISPTYTTLILAVLFGTHSITAAAAKAPTDGSQSQPITVVFSRDQPGPHSSDSYAMCFGVTSVAGTQVVTPTACSAKQSVSEVRDGPLKSGKKLLVILTSGNCSSLYLYLQKQTISAADEYPVRGAAPTKAASANETFGIMTEERLTSSACYALYPDPLTSDTYTTVHIASKEAADKYSDIASKALPDIHTFYRFGVSTGVAVSSVQNRTYGYSQGSTATQFSPITLSDPRLVEPVLFLTYYPLHGGLDTEAHASWRDIGLVAGLSEKNPTSSFYVGISTEPVRNLQLIVGANASQVNVLDSSAFDAGPSASHSSPTTRAAYRFGAYIGIAFGFSNFLQQVFK